MNRPSPAFHQILLATDGSEGARRAARRAVGLARAIGAKLSLISVYEVAPFPLFSAGLAPSTAGLITPETVDIIETDAQRAAQLAVEQATDIAREAGVEVSETRVVMGNINRTIIDTAKELNVDLIVVGSHGWNALERLILGSTADHLVRTAPCSVLVVRPGPDNSTSTDPA